MSREFISIVQGESSLWDPNLRILTLTKDPLETSHEISHIKLEHTSSMGSKLSDLLEEREAWVDTLRRINSEEIKVWKVHDSLNSYLREVGEEYGFESPQYRMGARWLEEVVSLAKKRKKEAK